MSGISLHNGVGRDFIEVGGFRFTRVAGDKAREENERGNKGRLTPRLYRFWNGCNLSEKQIKAALAELKLK